MEKHFKTEIITKLKSHFDFYPEVKGTHFSGKRLSLDHIIIPKNCPEWRNKNIVFGLEYKDVERIDGDTTNFTRWLGQCVDYANTKWDNYGYIYILTCPGIRTTEFIQKIDSNWMLARVMGHLGIGELKVLKNYGWSITLHDSHRLWSEIKGVESGKTWNLKRKFGSR
jgi:hypothetical protein